MLGGKSDGRWLIPVALIAAIAATTFLFAARASRFGGAGVSQTLSAQVTREDTAPRPVPTSQPSLYQILRAADMLARAGAIPTPVPAPTEVPLIDVLRAADALAKAGLLPAPPTPETPPLIDILRAADALAKAGLLPTPPQPGVAPLAKPPASAPLPPQATPPPIARAVAGPGGWYDDAYSSRVWDLINQQRSGAGLQAVAQEPRLASAAAAYARVLSDNNWFSHVGPDGSTLVSRVEAAGFPFNVPIGEILAWGTDRWSADAMVQAWMNSPMHRQEILSGDYKRAGISCYFTTAAGVTVHCVMDFAG
ncbi:MAG TPA: CAP domain-containing protein [Dehalococcoidia bacterium]|nr:CAP domain-containing protein [Dehalococcoidia bacterium]